MARTDAAAPVRVGRIEFVNCFPLYHHLERELAARGLQATIVEGDPAALNAMLVAGEIDVALPSSIAFARHAHELVLLPRVSISSFGAVDSVQLFTRVPLREVQRIAVTAKSATSVCLLHILCRAWGMEPEFCLRQGSLAEVLADFDALMLIGDEALYVLRAEVFPHQVDLGAAWYELTGLPMVFAVCAAREGFVSGRPAAANAVGASLLASRDECAANPLETAAAAALRYEFSRQFLADYFEKLKFGFTPEYRAGLEEFYRRAAAIGELAVIPDLSTAELTPAPRGVQAAVVAPSRTPGLAFHDIALVSDPSAGLVPVPDAAPVTAAASVAPPAFSDLTWREAEPGDAHAVVQAIEDWWPGFHIVHGVCPQLFEHFGDTSIIVEDDGELVGFLAGYLSQRLPDAGYVHYAGVRRDARGLGVGRAMYERFAALVRARGRERVVAETGAWNGGSIAFHRRIGFVLESGDEMVDGLPVCRDVTGMGFDYVRMTLPLAPKARP